MASLPDAHPLSSLAVAEPVRVAWLRRHWLGLSLISGAVVVLLLVAVSFVPFSSEAARKRVIKEIATRMDADVELETLRFRILPGLRAEGTGLVVRQRGRLDVPPLISIPRFAVDGGFLAFLDRHIARVTLEGLDIEIPPDRHIDLNGDKTAPPAATTTADKTQPSASASAEPEKKSRREFVIDDMFAKEAKVVIHPKNPIKHPKTWTIHDLTMHSVAFDRAMPFEAVLTNAVPPGTIHTKGSFGPWGADDPGNTPLEGDFTFDHADLSVFKGISGTLSAHGRYGGSLAQINVQGETETPDFAVTVGAHPVALHATYRANVDGTNGNTVLEQIDASFLKTSLTAKGAVIDNPGPKGRTVSLDVTIAKGRLEDVLHLAVNSDKPPLTGALAVKTKFVLPPGKDRTVIEKLQLNGTFVVADAAFSSPDVQNKIDELSHRSRGKEQAPVQRVTSHLEGKFALKDGTLSLPKIAFNVPGSVVELSGGYALVPGTLDFTGMLYMDAKISETTSGWKRMLLKAIDPLFKREGGGSAIPIKVTGDRNNPSFGLDRSRVFKHD